MNLDVEPYAFHSERLPCSGRHILAQFDEHAIVVYQAYRPAIGHWAAEHGRFGGEFRLNRMSWIKTSFLWMIYRSGWATKPGQEVILAVWLRRAGFEAILAEAVPAVFDPALYREPAEWARAVARSTVRLQWDPDRTPGGGCLGRRAGQPKVGTSAWAARPDATPVRGRVDPGYRRHHQLRARAGDARQASGVVQGPPGAMR